MSTGMVTVCAGCDAFRPWVAVLLGACGGSLYLAASLALVKLKIDDPLDASAIHASCGMSLTKVRAKMSKISVAFSGLLGLLANPIFRNNGILVTASEESLNMLMWNSIGAGKFFFVTSQITICPLQSTCKTTISFSISEVMLILVIMISM